MSQMQQYTNLQLSGSIPHQSDPDRTGRRNNHQSRPYLLPMAKSIADETAMGADGILGALLDELEQDVAADGVAMSITSALDGTTLLEMNRGHGIPLEHDPRTQRQHFNPGEGLHSCLCTQEGTYQSYRSCDSCFLQQLPVILSIPLLAHNYYLGVLWVGRHTEFTRPEIERIETMVARLAGTLYTMQWMNSEMQDTCDRMLDTWSQLLALHPQESIEHIYGVAQTTLALARFLRLNENVLVHVWRGALLHDIGKIGIPKRLLQKPGPLDATEWRMMRQHPLYAYELLWPTPFLRPALDIPLYHHEKWDGTGYPYQLKGEDIPLAARLFAIVDVWYSLSEERLYRSRWNEQHIRDYIQLQSGRHFDPTLVAAFFAWRFGTAWTETLSY